MPIAVATRPRRPRARGAAATTVCRPARLRGGRRRDDTRQHRPLARARGPHDGEALALPAGIEERVQPLALVRKRGAQPIAQRARAAAPALGEHQLVDRVGERARAGETIVGPQRERPFQQRIEPLVLVQSRGRAVAAPLDLVERLARVLLAERALAREQRVQQHARREHVRTQVDRLARASVPAT